MKLALVAAAKNTSIVMVGNSYSQFKLLLIIAALLGLITVASGQGNLSEDPDVARMMDAFATLNKSRSTVKAWRIQVLASGDRRKVESEKERFENIYPYYRLELVHDNPYYIIKIRDVAYREKIDALHLLHRIKRRYPAAILVLDDVKPQKLLTSER